MKKFFIVIRNIFVGIFLIVYFSFIILISTLLLNKNNYGVTEIGEKALILVDDKIANENYKKGSLVVIEKKEINELKVGQEVFVYQPDKKDKSVNIVISNIQELFPEDDSPYLTLTNNGSAWGEEYIGGITYSTYDKIGAVLKFIESKWVFFILLIIPCFFILLYEVYLLIIAIKFDDLDDDEEIEKEIKTKEPEIKEANVAIEKDIKENSDDKLSYIEKQIMELKANSNSELSEIVEDKNEKIEDLMQQISALRKEYDEKDTFTQEIPVLNDTNEITDEVFKEKEDTKDIEIENQKEESVVKEEKVKIDTQKSIQNQNNKQQNNKHKNNQPQKKQQSNKQQNNNQKNNKQQSNNKKNNNKTQKQQPNNNNNNRQNYNKNNKNNNNNKNRNNNKQKGKNK